MKSSYKSQRYTYNTNHSTAEYRQITTILSILFKFTAEFKV